MKNMQNHDKPIYRSTNYLYANVEPIHEHRTN